MTAGKLIRYGLVVLGMTVMLGCATSPPEQVDNVCDIFREKSGWYEAVSYTHLTLPTIYSV